jgi:hypothetical protein
MGVERDDLANFVLDRVREHPPNDFIDVHCHKSAQFTNVICADWCEGEGDSPV